MSCGRNAHKTGGTDILRTYCGRARTLTSTSLHKKCVHLDLSITLLKTTKATTPTAKMVKNKNGKSRKAGKAATPTTPATPVTTPVTTPAQDREHSPAGRITSPLSSPLSSKRMCRLSERNELAVIEWVKNTPEMWDQKNANFKNRQNRDKMWEDKARELNLNPEHLRVGYRDLRDWNTKLQRPPKSGLARTHDTRASDHAALLLPEGHCAASIVACVESRR